MTTSLRVAGVLIGSFLFLKLVVASPDPVPPGEALATGKYSSMEMLLERTIFKVNAAKVRVRVDENTQDKIARAIKGKKPSREIEHELANAIFEGEDSRIELELLRDVDYRMFAAEIRKGSRCAHEAELTDQKESERVDQNVDKWFAPVVKRGLKKGDRLIYEIEGGKVHTRLISASGDVLVETFHEGKGPRYSVLGGYFARCSAFRVPLFRSLFAQMD